jgi:hypothetical protein
MVNVARKQDVARKMAILISCMVVSSVAGVGTKIFDDGFESGLLCSWSSAYPAVSCPENIYFVSNTDVGADYASVAAVNAANFSPGDTILFKRGDTFLNDLEPASNGSLNNNIVYGAYGAGEDPTLWSVDLLHRRHITVQDMHFDMDAGGGGSSKTIAIGCYDVEKIIIRRCEVENAPQHGAYIGPFQDVQIIDCIFHDNGVGFMEHNIYLSGDGTPVGSDNIVIDGCEVYNAGTVGIQMNPNGNSSENFLDNVTIRNCRIHDNEVGIGDYGSRNLLLHNNYIYNNKGIDYYNDQIGGNIVSTGAKIYNNTFYNLNPSWGDVFYVNHCTGCSFKNNIVYAPIDNLSIGGGASVTFDYNMYQVSSWNWGTWSAWQTAGNDPNGYDDDPEMNDPLTEDFTLSTSPASPAIDAGVDVGFPFDGTAPDIGAHETH